MNPALQVAIQAQLEQAQHHYNQKTVIFSQILNLLRANHANFDQQVLQKTIIQPYLQLIETYGQQVLEKWSYQDFLKHNVAMHYFTYTLTADEIQYLTDIIDIRTPKFQNYTIDLSDEDFLDNAIAPEILIRLTLTTQQQAQFTMIKFNIGVPTEYLYAWYQHYHQTFNKPDDQD